MSEGYRNMILEWVKGEYKFVAVEEDDGVVTLKYQEAERHATWGDVVEMHIPSYDAREVARMLVEMAEWVEGRDE